MLIFPHLVREYVVFIPFKGFVRCSIYLHDRCNWFVLLCFRLWQFVCFKYKKCTIFVLSTKQVHLNSVDAPEPEANRCALSVHIYFPIYIFFFRFLFLLLGIVYFRWHHIYAAILLILFSVCILSVITFETWSLMFFVFIPSQLHCFWPNYRCFSHSIVVDYFYVWYFFHAWFLLVERFFTLEYFFCGECVACVHAFCSLVRLLI